MSAVSNNGQVNQSANLFQQGNDAIGMTAEQARDLKAIASMVYGSREGVKGGKGYVGAFTDSRGNVHLAKMMTHRGEYKGVEGNEKAYLEKLEKSGAEGEACAKALRESTQRLCDRLIDIARAVGKEKEVADMLGLKIKKDDGDGQKKEDDGVKYEYPPLLSRKIGISAIKAITENAGRTSLKMRADVQVLGDDNRFDWDDIAKNRAKTIENTDAVNVYSRLTDADIKDEIGQKVAVSGRTGETVGTAGEIAYFKCIDVLKKCLKDKGNKASLSDVNASNPGLIAKAREGQKLRLEKTIDTLRFDGEVKSAYLRIMGKMVNLHAHICNRADDKCKNIGDTKREFKALNSNSLLSPRNEIQAPFASDKANEAFLYMMKKGMREELARIKSGKGEAPITPRELDEFMFKVTCKAFACSIALDAAFEKMETLSEELIKAGRRPGGSGDDDKVTVPLNWKFDAGEKVHYDEISKANLFGEVKEENIAGDRTVGKGAYEVAQGEADIKRCRVLYATVLSYFDNEVHALDYKTDAVVGAFRDGSYYRYEDNDPEKNKEKRALLDRGKGDGLQREMDYLLSYEDGDYDTQKDTGADGWGKMIEQLTEKSMRDTLFSTSSTVGKNLFNQGGDGGTKGTVSYKMQGIKEERGQAVFT